MKEAQVQAQAQECMEQDWIRELRRWRDRHGPHIESYDMNHVADLKELDQTIFTVASESAQTWVCSSRGQKNLAEAERQILDIVGIPLKNIENHPNWKGKGARLGRRDIHIQAKHSDRSYRRFTSDLSNRRVLMGIAEPRDRVIEAQQHLKEIQKKFKKQIWKDRIQEIKERELRIRIEKAAPWAQEGAMSLPNLAGHQTVLCLGTNHLKEDDPQTQGRISGDPREAGKALHLRWARNHSRDQREAMRKLFAKSVEGRPGCKSCWIHNAEGTLEIRSLYLRRHCSTTVTEARNTIQSYHLELTKNPRVRRVLKSAIPWELQTLVLIRMIAETERRTQFAENHPEQIAQIADQHWSAEAIQEFFDRVDQNRIKKDPLAPKPDPASRSSIRIRRILRLPPPKLRKSPESCRAYLLLKNHQRRRESAKANQRERFRNGEWSQDRVHCGMNDRLIAHYGFDNLRAIYREDPQRALRFIQRMRESAEIIPKHAVEFETLLGKIFSNVPQNRALLEIGHPFWNGGGEHHYGQLEECIEHLRSMIEQHREARGEKEKHIQTPDILRALRQETCGPGRIRNWVIEWHAIQNHPGKRLAVGKPGEYKNSWDPPRGWDEWMADPQGGQKYPGLQPVTDSQTLQELGDANAHCIAAYEKRTEIHILTHPMWGDKPILNGPCAVITLAADQRTKQYSVYMNLQHRNQPISKIHKSWIAAGELNRFLNRWIQKQSREGNGANTHRVLRNSRINPLEHIRAIESHYRAHLRNILPKTMQDLFESQIQARGNPTGQTSQPSQPSQPSGDES